MDSLPTGAKRSSTKSRKTRLGSDCGSDHELLIAKFRLKLKKVGKTTRPFRYDLNQIPYNYTVEVNSLLLSFTEGKFHPPLLSTSGPLHLLCPLFLQTVSGHTHFIYDSSHILPLLSPCHHYYCLHKIHCSLLIASFLNWNTKSGRGVKSCMPYLGIQG